MAETARSGGSIRRLEPAALKLYSGSARSGSGSVRQRLDPAALKLCGVQLLTGLLLFFLFALRNTYKLVLVLKIDFNLGLQYPMYGILL